MVRGSPRHSESNGGVSESNSAGKIGNMDAGPLVTQVVSGVSCHHVDVQHTDPSHTGKYPLSSDV